MKRGYFPALLILLLASLLQGCVVKNALKKGSSFENAGMFRDAAEVYYHAFKSRPGNTDLKIALKRAGQLYTDEQAEKISRSYHQNDYRNTVYTWMTTRDFMDKMARAGIDLQQDAGSDRLYHDAVEKYLNQRYEEGQRLIGEQRFGEAGSVFSEIEKIDPGFKDTRNYLKQATLEPLYREGARLYGEGKFMEAYAKWKSVFDRDKGYNDVAEKMQQALYERYKEGTLLLMNENFREAASALGEVFRAEPSYRDVRQLFSEARNEPVYRQGDDYLRMGKCRSAFFAFDQVVDDAGSYKEAVQKRESALACAQYPVAIAITGRRGTGISFTAFQSLLTGQILQQKNLFIKVFDLAALEPSRMSQLSFSNGQPNPDFLRYLETRHQIKALLYVDFPVMERQAGTLKKEEKTGFERSVQKNQAGETITTDTRVRYEEYSQRNSVNLNCQYRLIATGTGETLMSDKILESRQDEIRYITYGGNADKLYPAQYRNGVYAISTNDYRHVQNLLKGRRTIQTVERLTDEALNPVAKSIARAVDQFNPE